MHLDHMPIQILPTRQQFILLKNTINLRLVVLSFALMTLLTMQHSLIWHAMHHLTSLPAQSSLQSIQKEVGAETTCLKCIEDLAHSIALPTGWLMPFAQTVHVLSIGGLAPNQIFLSPERANQRGPPNFV